MARIRTIKPDFFTSEQIMELRPLTRLLFIGIWPFADDNGVHVASVKTLKAQIFPADDILLVDIALMIDELIIRGLLVEYSSNGRHYWHVTGWHKHQKVDRKNPKHPFPYEQNQIVVKDSSIIRRIIDERSPPEGNGREWKGMERSMPAKETLSTEDTGEPKSVVEEKGENPEKHLPTEVTGSETRLRQCVAEKREWLEEQFPDFDIGLELEEMVAKYRGQSIGADPWLLVIRWFRTAAQCRPRDRPGPGMGPGTGGGVMNKGEALIAANVNAAAEAKRLMREARGEA